ncbi:MAG: hypothetical protein ACI89X_003637 [Planctomycetota bacterium]|jgi:hypothetical protein
MIGCAPPGRRHRAPTPRAAINSALDKIASTGVAEHLSGGAARAAGWRQNHIQQSSGKLTPHSTNRDEVIVHTDGGTRVAVTPPKCRDENAQAGNWSPECWWQAKRRFAGATVAFRDQGSRRRRMLSGALFGAATTKGSLLCGKFQDQWHRDDRLETPMWARARPG